MAVKRAPEVAVLLGGGIDSAALVDAYRRQKTRIEAVHVDYGQRASKAEARASRRIAKHYRIPLRIVRPQLKLTRRGEEYELRNVLLVLLAAANTKAPRLALGIHRGPTYYDCSDRFVTDLQRILDGYYQGGRRIETPWLTVGKADVIAYAQKNRVPLHLTYSCQTGRAKACGRCSSCRDRKEVDAQIARRTT